MCIRDRRISQAERQRRLFDIAELGAEIRLVLGFVDMRVARDEFAIRHRWRQLVAYSCEELADFVE